MDSHKRLENLILVSSILHKSLDLSVLLQRIIAMIPEIMGSERGTLYLMDNETGEFVLSIAEDKAEPTGKEKLRIARQPGAVAIVGQGVPVLIEDASKDPRWKEGSEGIKSVLCVPLRFGDKIIGLIEALNKLDNLSYDEEDLRFFQTVADICAAAILNSSKYTALAVENRRLKSTPVNEPLLIGNSRAITKVMTIIKKASSTDATVLITGESGTGKELVAKEIHRNSNRSKNPFLPINCGALSETLLESELFGHEKGAFTGADRVRAGIFEEAHGGTVFLDEIGDTPISTQVKLLRVLQEGKIKRLGSNREIQFDARVVAATNRELELMVKEGMLREDLYYRLNVIRISIPPLRDRREDIPTIANYLLRKICVRTGKTIQGFSPAVIRQLTESDWKGNIRELENLIETAIAMSENDIIELSDLPNTFLPNDNNQFDAFKLARLTYDKALDSFEQHYFGALLSITNGDTSEAAKRAAISEKSVSRRKKRFNL